MAFQTAAGIAYKEGLPTAGPTLLEPIGELKVFIPDANMGDIIGDLNKRRGRVMGMNPDPDNRGWQIVEAEVPMGEMSSYAIDCVPCRRAAAPTASSSSATRKSRRSIRRRSSRTPRRQTRNNPKITMAGANPRTGIYYRFFSHSCSMARKPHCSSGRSSCAS